jgi:hypothetical protein
MPEHTQQRPLDRILGKVDVAQQQVRGPEQARQNPRGEALKFLVSY